MNRKSWYELRRAYRVLTQNDISRKWSKDIMENQEILAETLIRYSHKGSDYHRTSHLPLVDYISFCKDHGMPDSQKKSMVQGWIKRGLILHGIGRLK